MQTRANSFENRTEITQQFELILFYKLYKNPYSFISEKAVYSLTLK